MPNRADRTRTRFYLPEEVDYRCPAAEQLPYRFTSEEDGKRLRRYRTIVGLNPSARQGQSGGFHDGSMSIRSKLCSSALMRIHKRCTEHRETVEHPFGTMRGSMGRRTW
jgi:hypothetical protein